MSVQCLCDLDLYNPQFVTYIEQWATAWLSVEHAEETIVVLLYILLMKACRIICVEMD